MSGGEPTSIVRVPQRATQQLLFLELNEVNFDHVRFYCERGRLPNLDALIRTNGWVQTTSETEYEHLEPWIQWVTAHTGLTYAEHRVFRLGDVVKRDLAQIWEMLEARGLRVGAISPMNAANRLSKAAFFVPDPWTKTPVSGRKVLHGLHAAIVQAVNDNAQSRLTLASLVSLLRGMVKYVEAADVASYARLAATGRRRPWRKAILLDLLLADVFIKEVAATQPHFATLFVNAAAHIQHHYMFSAACYDGGQRNPEWYLPPGCDPVAEVYEAYDAILGKVLRAFPAARVMLATGLHQDPHGKVTYYWRLRRHEQFLRKIGVPFVGVEPRMSRDFLIKCANREQAAAAAERLSKAVGPGGVPLFDVDNRGVDLFIMLVYPHDVPDDFRFSIGSESFSDFRKDIVFVALKNGQHNGLGYFIDTAMRFEPTAPTIPLASIPERIMDALQLSSAAPVLRSAAR